jgi:hypothetical protein
MDFFIALFIVFFKACWERSQYNDWFSSTDFFDGSWEPSQDFNQEQDAY